MGGPDFSFLSFFAMLKPMLHLTLLPQILAICRLEHDAPVPSWTGGEKFVSITRTGDELSVVCSQQRVPDGVTMEGGWRAFKVEGPLEFSLTGILSSLTLPLAEAGIPVFALSTFDTDYLLVKGVDVETAERVLGQFCFLEEEGANRAH